jgi:hypothetical protein
MAADFFTTECWKKTALGTAIELFSSHTLNELRKLQPIILMGGVHGDEPEGVRLAQDTLNWLKNQSRASVAPWVVIPCLNIDGFARRTRVNGRGVDLNRNYPSRDWSEKFEKERYFPGPSAGSEPEIQGVVELMRELRPRLMIHCHSWQPCIVGTGSAARLDSERLAQSSSYEAREEIGYPTPGSLSRYGWYDHRIPVICIEEQDSLTDLSTIWPRFSAGMRAVFEDRSLRESK